MRTTATARKISEPARVIPLVRPQPRSIPPERIREWVRRAGNAPSGDNCQPWSFVWDGQCLDIHHSDFRACHALNRRHHASLLSLGAVLEIMRMSSAVDGFAVSTKLLPSNWGTKRPWAELQFVPGVREMADDLLSWIERRATDRRLYQGGSIDSPCFRQIEDEVIASASTRVYVKRVNSPELVRYIADCEKFIWTNERAHQDLMRWVRFDELSTSPRDGMPWTNLGVTHWESRILKWLRPWRRQRWMNRLGFLGVRCAKLRTELASAAGLVCFSTVSEDPRGLIELGGFALRAWLRFNSAGYGVQPLTLSSLSVYDAAIGVLNKDVSTRFVDLYTRGRSLLREEFGLSSQEMPVWMFRVGVSDPLPEAQRTPRLPVDAILSITI